MELSSIATGRYRVACNLQEIYIKRIILRYLACDSFKFLEN